MISFLKVISYTAGEFDILNTFSLFVCVYFDNKETEVEIKIISSTLCSLHDSNRIPFFHSCTVHLDTIKDIDNRIPYLEY
jgi:hypothetical protein